MSSALACPRCSERVSDVVDCRHVPEKRAFRRRRECRHCRKRWTTYEVSADPAELIGSGLLTDLEEVHDRLTDALKYIPPTEEEPDG